MSANYESLLTVALCTLTYTGQVLAQAAPATILKIDLDKFVAYRNDVTDYSKLATNPEVTTPAAALNFSTVIWTADIVAVNGTPVRGTHICRVLNIVMNTEPKPGQAIGDVNGPVNDCVDHILHPDGTPIGAITFTGRAASVPPPPGAPRDQPRGNMVVTGGTGAFLGVRGQAGETAGGNSRAASVTEDPARRRINGGGNFTLILHLIPMSRPEIVTTPLGPAVVHSSDFTFVTAAKPARSGETLTLYASGLGPTRPGVDPGQPFTTDPPQLVNSPLEITVNGKPAEVLYAGGHPGAVDRYQVNFRVPEGTTPGPASVQLTSAWITGPDVKIAVQ